MRIGAGALKGRRIRSAPGLRPTQDRVRAAMFNMLGERVTGARVLDLFAGTGSLGLEALSRGAVEVVFIEQNPRTVRTLRNNLAQTGLQERARILQADALRAAQGLARAGEVFDLVFLDPPYETGFAQRAVDTVARLNLLRPGGLIVAESSPREAIRPPEGYEIVRDRRYGDTRVVILARRGASS